MKSVNRAMVWAGTTGLLIAKYMTIGMIALIARGVVTLILAFSKETCSCLKGTRLLQMTSDQQREYHWAFGRHSRIPDCCINFFVEDWDMSEGWQNEGNWYHQAVDAARFGYVPCPKCLGTGRRIKIKDCDVECGGDHRQDFVPKEVLNERVG